jgi:hypothetical protein
LRPIADISVDSRQGLTSQGNTVSDLDNQPVKYLADNPGFVKFA